MGSKAYAEWIKMFDNNMVEAYKTERNELQKVAMLITGLKTELKSVSESLELEYSCLKQRLNENDGLKHTVKITNNSLHNLTQDSSLFESDSFSHSSYLKSPDIFQSNTSIDEDVTKIEESPTLSSKRKKKSRKFNKKPNNSKKNILEDIDKENSVFVECTPQPEKKVSHIKSKSSFFSGRKKNNSTITQLFGNMSSSNLNCDEKQSVILEDSDETFKQWNKEEDATELGITQLLSFINKDNTSNKNTNKKKNDDDLDSTQEVDEFSKAMLFDESPQEELSPKKKIKMTPLVEPVVRGNARKMLKGFSCAQCRDFYAKDDLSSQELQKKLDACSKHRYKYKPPEDTFPGIWDMTIPEENVNYKH